MKEKKMKFNKEQEAFLEDSPNIIEIDGKRVIVDGKLVIVDGKLVLGYCPLNADRVGCPAGTHEDIYDGTSIWPGLIFMTVSVGAIIQAFIQAYM